MRRAIGDRRLEIKILEKAILPKTDPDILQILATIRFETKQKRLLPATVLAQQHWISLMGVVSVLPNTDPNRNTPFCRVRSCRRAHYSESVSTGVWCVPGFGAGFEIALKPSELQKEGENASKGHFYFLRQTLVCTKPWFKRDLNYHYLDRANDAEDLGRKLLLTPPGAPRRTP